MKATAKKHAPVVAKLVFAATLIVGVGFGAQMTWAWAQVSPRFAVKGVVIRGNERATDAELVRLAGIATEGSGAAAGAPPSGGLLRLGDAPNVFQLDVDAVERAVATHPWVKTAHVTRHFPSHLAIEVTEHEAAAVVSLGELYLVDHDGLPFKRLQAQDGLDLPLITGLDRDGYTERPLEAHARIAAALEVLRAWTPAPSELRTSVQGITVVQADGVEVRLGEGDLQPKLERLARIRKELQSRKLTAEVIRLDNRMRPDWITVQLAPTTSSNSK